MVVRSTNTGVGYLARGHGLEKWQQTAGRNYRGGRGIHAPRKAFLLVRLDSSNRAYPVRDIDAWSQESYN